VPHDAKSLIHNDGSFWIALDGKTEKQVSDVELDCVWLIEKQ